jgi:hypothetical protein
MALLAQAGLLISGIVLVRVGVPAADVAMAIAEDNSFASR